MNWKPMSEAPKDGRQVMGWVGNWSYAVVVRWDSDQWCSEGSEYIENEFTHWAQIEPPIDKPADEHRLVGCGSVPKGTVVEIPAGADLVIVSQTDEMVCYEIRMPSDE